MAFWVGSPSGAIDFSPKSNPFGLSPRIGRVRGFKATSGLPAGRARSQPRAVEGLRGHCGDGPPAQRPPRGIPVPALRWVLVVTPNGRGGPRLRGKAARGG